MLFGAYRMLQLFTGKQLAASHLRPCLHHGYGAILLDCTFYVLCTTKSFFNCHACLANTLHEVQTELAVRYEPARNE